MMYNKYAFSAKIVGERNGTMWNGQFGSQTFSKFFPDALNSLEPTIQKICQGDFEDPKIAPFSTIEVMLIKPNRGIIRYFDVTMFPSIAQYIRKED